MSFKNNAIVVKLTIRAFAGRKKDHTATDKVQSEYLMSRDSGQYTKRLFPNCEELKRITKIAADIRNWSYKASLPWFQDGSRVLRSDQYLDFATAFQVRKQEFDSAVDQFASAYPACKANASLKLGRLYDESDYPHHAEIKDLFSCEISFLPVPDLGDFRVELSECERENFLAQMHETESLAMQDCFRRLHDVCAKAVGALGRPGGVIRESLIQNIKDVCEVLPTLNITDDPMLEQLRTQIDTVAQSINVVDCRESDTIRLQAKQSLAAAMDKMSAFMG